MTQFHIGYSARAVKDYPLERRQALVRLAEDLGFDVLWHSNERFYRDAWVNMTVSAMLTSRIGLGCAVADPYAIHPALIAQTLATVDEVARGRAIMGIGAGGSGFVPLGIQRRRPAQAIREAIEVTRRFLAGEYLDYQGEVVQFRGGQIHFHPRASIPIYVASRGKAVLEMGGAVADGVMIATYATPPGIEYAVAQVERGARKAGRRLDDVRLLVRVDTCVLPDRETARNALKQMLAFVLWTSYPDRGFVQQVGLQVPAELEALIARREYDLMHDAGPLVPDAFVDAFAWAGTPDDVAQQIARVVRLGIGEIGCWIQAPPGYDIGAIARSIATEVRPRVEALVAR